MPVKPLNAPALKTVLARIDEGRDALARSITPLSASSIEIRFSVQDKARDYDWIDVVFRIEGVRDAKLVSDNILQTLDMSEGITVELTANAAALAIGNYPGRVSEAPLYIVGTTIGYEELPFSG